VAAADAPDRQPQQAAERQHDGAINEEALAGPEAVGEAAHHGRDQDRAEPLSRLAQADDGALLMAADGAGLNRKDDRLDHALKPAARDLTDQQEYKKTAEQRC